jgi:glutathione S-transferase
MKLYYSAGACSLSPHILLEELDLPFELVKVDWTGADGTLGELNQISPGGYVPAIKMSSTQHLSEGVVICQYLGDLKPEKKLVPEKNTFARYQFQELMNFLSTEIHKGFSPLFGGKEAFTDETAKNQYTTLNTEKLSASLSVLSKRLGENQFLFENQFSAADIYAFVILSWTDYVKIDLSPWKNLAEFKSRIYARPAVQKAMKTEGLLG